MCSSPQMMLVMPLVKFTGQAVEKEILKSNKILFLFKLTKGKCYYNIEQESISDSK
jgi:hypothetical protein